MKRRSYTVVRSHQVESVPQVRRLPLVDLLVDARTELLELAIRSGMKVFATMVEEDRVAVCGPRYAHEPDREASRAGRVASAPWRRRMRRRVSSVAPDTSGAM